PTARAGVDAPGRFVFSIDRVIDWAGDAILARLILKIGLELGVRGIAEIGGGGGDLLLCWFAVGSAGFDFNFGERTGARVRTAGTFSGQIGIGQQFQTESGDAVEIGLGEERRRVLGGRVALREDRPVFFDVVALV